MYSIVKHSHIILVIVSLTFFQFRYWYFRVYQATPNRLAKLLPHLIDTFLLSSGVILAYMVGFSPFNSPWLLYKLFALLVYIVMGMLAMKKTGALQWFSYFLASSAVLYMIFAATQKVPWPQ